MSNLAQSDDKVLKIWRTSDWRLEKEIRAPFVNAPGTTLFRRLRHVASRLGMLDIVLIDSSIAGPRTVRKS